MKLATSQEELSHQLEKHKLGLSRGTVDLIPHSEEWAKAFELMLDRFKQVLRDDFFTFEFHHIGSTSILDLSAKPILDMLLVYSDRDHFLSSIPILVQMGLTHKGDMVGKLSGSGDDDRHFFSLYDKSQTIDYLHLHALAKTHEDVGKFLRFRDQLRASPALRKEYEELKANLKSSGTGRLEYLQSKTKFVVAVSSK